MTKKIQLLTHEETQVEHEFYEDSPVRIAMEAARRLILQLPLDHDLRGPPPGRSRRHPTKSGFWEVEVKTGEWAEVEEVVSTGTCAYFFMSERNDGLWVVFLKEEFAEAFLDLLEAQDG